MSLQKRLDKYCLQANETDPELLCFIDDVLAGDSIRSASSDGSPARCSDHSRSTPDLEPSLLYLDDTEVSELIQRKFLGMEDAEKTKLDMIRNEIIKNEQEIRGAERVRIYVQAKLFNDQVNDHKSFGKMLMFWSQKVQQLKAKNEMMTAREDKHVATLRKLEALNSF